MSPTPTAIERLIESSPWSTRWFSIALGLLFVGVDYLSGPELFVPIYFVLPAMLMAWNWGVRAAVALSVALSLIHLAFILHWGSQSAPGIMAANALMRSSVLILLALITARLGTQTRASRERVKILEGILPTCSFCKDIRDPEGDWHRIEAYVSARSEAQFSHGICPKCALERYGVTLDPQRAPQPNGSTGQ